MINDIDKFLIRHKLIKEGTCTHNLNSSSLALFKRTEFVVTNLLTEKTPWPHGLTGKFCYLCKFFQNLKKMECSPNYPMRPALSCAKTRK
jgi:hypothetical protein